MILMLLLAWRDPLWHFHHSMEQQHHFNNFSSHKALQMSGMVHQLRKGVEKVAEKVSVAPLWQTLWGRSAGVGPNRKQL